MKDNGRPEYPDEQYQNWLESMRPFLENSNSLYYAMEQTGISQHKNAIYRKYRLKDWFWEKIEQYRSKPGELVNDTFVTLVRNISDRAKRKEALTTEDINVLKFFAEKSRSAQGFFVTRTETADAKPLEDIFEELDNGVDTAQDELAGEAQKQVVEAKPPVQDQGQVGTASDVQAQPDPNAAPSRA